MKDSVALHMPYIMFFYYFQHTHTLSFSLSLSLSHTHTQAGTDRTGEVSGAYYMRYLNMTFLDALSIDDHIQSRDM